MWFSDLPAEHSLYIEHALETILEPVIDGVSKLKKAAQLGVVSQAINAFCEAWKNNILKHKIKFRSGLIHKTIEPTLTLGQTSFTKL